MGRDPASGVGAFRQPGSAIVVARSGFSAAYTPSIFAAVSIFPPVRIIREDRPQVLLTYNEFGGYGHPDHIQAHRVAMRGAELAADPAYAPELGPAWDIPKIYWSVIPRSAIRLGLEKLAELGQHDLFGITKAEDAPFAVDDELVTTSIEGAAFADQRRFALLAHATQVQLDHPFSAFSAALGRVPLRDYYPLAKGTAGDRDAATGLERDLFAGL